MASTGTQSPTLAGELRPHASVTLELRDGSRLCAVVDREGRVCSHRGWISLATIAAVRPCTHRHEY